MLIDSFKGQYAFLSNFYVCPFPIVVGSKQAKTVEALFQANKTLDPITQDKILSLSTGTAAKKLGQKVELRPDWDEKKVGIMEYLISLKFPLSASLPNGSLTQKLVATGDAHLVEGNDWGDQFWGCVRPPDVQNGPWMGQNWLGVILMDRRARLNGQVG